MAIVIVPPVIELTLSVFERDELVDVQELIAQPAVERYMDSPLLQAWPCLVVRVDAVAAIYPALW